MKFNVIIGHEKDKSGKRVPVTITFDVNPFSKELNRKRTYKECFTHAKSLAKGALVFPVEGAV